MFLLSEQWCVHTTRQHQRSTLFKLISVPSMVEPLPPRSWHSVQVALSWRNWSSYITKRHGTRYSGPPRMKANWKQNEPSPGAGGLCQQKKSYPYLILQIGLQSLGNNGRRATGVACAKREKTKGFFYCARRSHGEQQFHFNHTPAFLLLFLTRSGWCKGQLRTHTHA